MNFMKKKILFGLALLMGAQSVVAHAEEYNNSKATAIGAATACTGIGAAMAAEAYVRKSMASILQSRPLVMPTDRHFSPEQATILSAVANGELNKAGIALCIAGLTFFLSPLIAQAITKKFSSKEDAEVNGLKAAVIDASSTATLAAITLHQGSFISSATKAAIIFVAKAFLPAVLYAWNTRKKQEPTEETKKEQSERDNAIRLAALQKYFKN